MTFLEIQKIFNEKIKKAKYIAVTQPKSEEEAVFIANNLIKKNIFAMEIAYRNLENLSLTDSCIAAVRKNVPQMLVGAATVTNGKLAKRAKKSGAQFILSAGFNEETVRTCKKLLLPVFPGVATPSEIEKALSYGLTVLKVFPISNLGGTSYLKALSGPYPNVSFIVSGGVNAENEESYRTQKNVYAVSGSWLAI